MAKRKSIKARSQSTMPIQDKDIASALVAVANDAPVVLTAEETLELATALPNVVSTVAASNNMLGDFGALLTVLSAKVDGLLNPQTGAPGPTGP
jgi:hypothetical protein